MEEMCPGCVFAKNMEEQYINEELSVETTNDYSTLGNIFLGYITENGVVKREFGCGITENGEPFCLEGGFFEGELENKPIYQKNKQILDHFFSNCENLTDDNINGYNCSDSNVYSAYISEVGDANVFITRRKSCGTGPLYNNNIHTQNVFASCV